MDLKAIGINSRMIERTEYSDVNQSGIRKNRVESDKEHMRPQDKSTSVVNKDKGRIIDVSF
ncbi:MAG: hypothetical protein KKH94_08200 [Candidatus Omnitrophica bacterium]|nr:hypothetical protein [Candidatus Omnitrophota bacterium]